MQETSNTKLVVSSNAGAFMYFFGYLPLIVGTIILYFLYIHSINAKPIQAGGFLTVFGVMSTLVGMVVALGRKGVNFYKDKDTIEAWWGLLVPFKKKIYPKSEFETIALVTQVSGSNPTPGEVSTHKIVRYSLMLGGTTRMIKLKTFRKQADTVSLSRVLQQVSGYEVSSDLGIVELGYPDQSKKITESAPILTSGLSLVKGVDIENHEGRTYVTFPLVLEMKWLVGNLSALLLALLATILILDVDYLMSERGKFFLYLLPAFSLMYGSFVLGSHRKRPIIVISDDKIELFEKNLFGIKTKLGDILRDEVITISEQQDKIFGIRGQYQSIHLWNGLTRADLKKLYSIVNSKFV